MIGREIIFSVKELPNLSPKVSARLDQWGDQV